MQKKNLWLWILGWLIFFPIPLTVLIVRSGKLGKTLKGVILTLLWLPIVLLGIAGSKAEPETVDVDKAVTETVETIAETTTSAETATVETTAETTTEIIIETTTAAETTTEATTTTETTTTTAETTTTTTTTTYEADTDSASSNSVSDTVIALISPVLDKSFPEENKIEYDSDLNVYNISVWHDGIAAELTLSGTDHTSWDNLVSQYEELCNSLWNVVKAIDPDANVTLSILNDLNKDNVLLMIYNGVTFYNAAE